MRSGPARVVASGMATTFWGYDLTFQVDEGEVPFTITLAWVADPEVDQLQVRTAWPSGGLRFELVNFEGAEGRGTAEPVLLTEVGDEVIFLHFRVFRYGRTQDWTVHYTFYAASKGDVGWQPVARDG